MEGFGVWTGRVRKEASLSVSIASVKPGEEMDAMKSYNCQMVKIGNCLRTKRYGRKIYEGGKNPRRSKAERSAEIAEVADNPLLSKLEKLIHTAILEPSKREEHAGKRPDRTPKPGRLTLSERERFCHLMDRNFCEGHKFLTLTYEKEDVSLDESVRDFENWVKRMRERYDDFKYLAVRSFQRSGTLHYHLLADLPTIPRAELADGTFSAIWGHGSVDLRRIYCLPMEGHLRAILGPMTVEDVYRNRDEFARNVAEKAGGRQHGDEERHYPTVTSE
ncbi:hypothetical protein D3H35_08145 [Cohnella faecalis]|uniref:Replication-associated protein ORF2/G2P domain-containing protein n=2 Tax=Cohnella faecalis TaxID=2315694 RepID=A0A398CN66_9BACL|nr:hypothetical protein D3H35_08145 [Cohnella faecalis]